VQLCENSVEMWRRRVERQKTKSHWRKGVSGLRLLKFEFMHVSVGNDRIWFCTVTHGQVSNVNFMY
jgi:hypothetical protein